MNPLVTIVMATYNRAHLIEETLVSIQNQSYTHWECLIIDDGADDATEEVISPLLAKDFRFTYYHRSDTFQKGLPGCRNYGLDLAKGEYLIFFDDDDLVHPQNLELSIGVLKSRKSDFCVYKMQSFTESFTGTFDTQIADRDIKIINLYNFLTNKVPIASCTVMWHISCFDTIRFNEDLMYAEEWECYTRILTTNKKGVLLSNILYFNRKHAESNTGEFWNNDPVRRASKVDATKCVITTLAQKKLLTYKLAVYMGSMAHFLNENSIYSHLISVDSNLNTFDKFKLFMRHHLKYVVQPIYKLKRKLQKK